MFNVTECNFPIIGKVFIYIKERNLLEFTKRQFKNYIVSIKKNSGKINNFVLIKTEIKNSNFENIFLGRKVKFENNKINFSIISRTQKINYNYDFNDKLRIKINFTKKPLYLIRQLITSKYSLNHILFYHTVLYPIFSLYSILKNYFLVHGSLLSINNKSIILTGLDGVGKSSLSNELVKNGAKILADNFILFNGKSFLGLNMPIRLDLKNDTNENIIYQDNSLKEVLYLTNEYQEVLVDKVYFLAIGENLNIKKLNKSVYLNWHLINNGAGEILDANLFNLPFYYYNIINNFNYLHYNDNIEYYLFSIPKGEINRAVKELMCQLNI